MHSKWIRFDCTQSATVRIGLSARRATWGDGLFSVALFTIPPKEKSPEVWTLTVHSWSAYLSAT